MTIDRNMGHDISSENFNFSYPRLIMVNQEYAKSGQIAAAC